MASDFIHCHCHSDFSTYDGFQTVPEMVAKAKQLGFPGIALTDHGKVGGFIKLQKACKPAKEVKDGQEYLLKEIKSIFGNEMYLVDDLSNPKGQRYHQTVLAKNNKGIENLYKLTSLSSENTYRGFPRIDWEMLKVYSEGLIIASGCIVGKFANLIVNENIEEAEKLAKKYKDVWGNDFYIEIMWTGYEPQKVVIKHGVDIAKKLGIKTIISNDVHFLSKNDGESQRVKIAISRNGPLQKDEYRDYQMYMKTYDEMLKTFGEGRKEFLHNTMEIFNKAEAKITLGQAKLPIFEIPEDNEEYNIFKKTWHPETPESETYLHFLAEKGLKNKKLWDKTNYRERLYKELETIKFTGFETYFLIVQDYISYARSPSVDIWRGSGRGCFLPECITYGDFDGKKHKKISEIEIGDFVYSHDKKLHEVKIKHEYNIDEEVTEITMDDGKIIKCTNDHKIYVKRNGKFVWIQAKDLIEHDELFEVEDNKIVKIKFIKKEKYNGKVYDLTVNDSFSYNIDGLAVHNSGAGSLVLYVLDVTGIDPIKYGLSMDRFLFASANYRARISDFFGEIEPGIEEDIRKNKFIIDDKNNIS